MESRDKTTAVRAFLTNLSLLSWLLAKASSMTFMAIVALMAITADVPNQAKMTAAYVNVNETLRRW